MKISMTNSVETINALNAYNEKRDNNERPILQLVEEKDGSQSLKCVDIGEVGILDRILSLFGLGSISLGNINAFLTARSNKDDLMAIEIIIGNAYQGIEKQTLGAINGLAKLNFKFGQHNQKIDSSIVPTEAIKSPEINESKATILKLLENRQDSVAAVGVAEEKESVKTPLSLNNAPGAAVAGLMKSMAEGQKKKTVKTPLGLNNAPGAAVAGLMKSMAEGQKQMEPVAKKQVRFTESTKLE